MLPSSHCAPSLGQRGLDGGNPHGAAILWEDFPSPGAVGPLPGPGAVCNVEELGMGAHNPVLTLLLGIASGQL